MANALVVNVRWVSDSMSLAQARTHTVVIDRHLEAGGADSGFLGGELFLAGLGGCLASNVVAAAGARKIELTKLVLHVCGTESDAPKRFTAIDVDVELLATSGGSEVAGTDLDKLVTVAERGCLVSNTLRDALELTINRKSAQIAVSA